MQSAIWRNNKIIRRKTINIKQVQYIVEDGKEQVVVTLRPEIAFRQTKSDLENLVLDFAADKLEALRGGDLSE